MITDQAALDRALDSIWAAPRDAGTVELVVRRPAVGEREQVDEAQLDPHGGLVGDGWALRPCKHTADRSPSPDRQLTIMSARAAAAVAGDRDAWPLAGDQLYVDLDLSAANLPAGTRLAVGGAIVEISAVPHTGCAKFTARFGGDATRWVNTPLGRELRLRGVNARVIVAGTVRRGDSIAKVER